MLSEDTLTLEQLEMGNQGVIHIHIGRSQPTEAHEENQQEIEMLDLSKLFIPLFGLILAIGLGVSTDLPVVLATTRPERYWFHDTSTVATQQYIRK